MAEPAERMRVLMVADVSPLSPAGGGERVLAEHARGLARRGHDVRVLGRAPVGGAPATVDADGVRVRHVAAPRPSMLRFARDAVVGARRATHAWLAEQPADVLVVQQPVGGYGALSAEPPGGRPALYSFLSPAPLEYRSRRGMSGRHRGGAAGVIAMLALWRLEAACLRRVRRIQVLSDYSADQLWRLYRIADDRVTRIPGGVDTTRFRPAPDRAAVRAALGLPAGRPLLLSVRNLEARMGLDTLLRAIALVRRDVPDVLLVVGGVGSRRQELAAVARSLGLDGAVSFVGWIGDDALPRYYQAADAFVLPSRELEGFGLVTVEALAAGTPVIGTEVGATPEILSSLDPSLLVPAGDAEALARRLSTFLAARDAADATRLRQACRHHAERLYSWPRAVGALEAELAALVRGVERPVSRGICAVCGGTAGRRALAYRGRRYVRCARCGTRSMARPPDDTESRHRYEVDYPRRFAASTGRRRALFAASVERLGPLPAGGRLLDVGCAGGDLVAEAAARGWRTTATDLSRAACAAAAVAGARAAQADAVSLPFRSASHDAVTLVNVLDHTAAPSSALGEALRVLRPGGRLAVRVPNGAVHALAAAILSGLGPAARLSGWDRRPMLHVHSLGPTALRRALETAGFDAVRVTNSPPADGAAHLAVRALAVAVAALSRGRWLVAPSIEAHARKPDEARDAPGAATARDAAIAPGAGTGTER